MNRRLYRSVHERVLGGVAGGVAEYFDLDPSLVRVAWAILILASVGGFLLLYIVMWIVVPEAPADYLPGHTWAAPPPVQPGTSAPTGDQSPGAAGPASDDAAGAATSGGAAPGSAAPDTAATGAESVAPGAPPAYGWADRRYQRRYRRRSGGGGIVIGAMLILIGAWFLARDTFNWIHLPDLWPILIIAVGLLLLYGAIRPRTD